VVHDGCYELDRLVLERKKGMIISSWYLPGNLYGRYGQCCESQLYLGHRALGISARHGRLAVQSHSPSWLVSPLEVGSEEEA
jgi:hypothetical protein